MLKLRTAEKSLILLVPSQFKMGSVCHTSNTRTLQVFFWLNIKFTAIKIKDCTGSPHILGYLSSCMFDLSAIIPVHTQSFLSKPIVYPTKYTGKAFLTDTGNDEKCSMMRKIRSKLCSTTQV